MKKVPFYYAPWHPGASYHVYNRAVSLNRLFVVEADVHKFRDNLKEKLRPFFEIYALACVGSHFHLHGRVRTLDAIERYLRALPRGELLLRQRRYLDGEVGFQELIGDVFARTFNGYAKAFNLRHGRTGGLFNQTVRRLRVRDDLLSRRLVAYLHCNEVKHGVGLQVQGLGYRTTFAEICRGQTFFCDAAAVLERFGGAAAFEAYHRAYKARRLAALRRFDERRFFGYERREATCAWAL